VGPPSGHIANVMFALAVPDDIYLFHDEDRLPSRHRCKYARADGPNPQLKMYSGLSHPLKSPQGGDRMDFSRPRQSAVHRCRFTQETPNENSHGRLGRRSWSAARYGEPTASVLIAPLMKADTSLWSFSRDFFSMYIMCPAS